MHAIHYGSQWTWVMRIYYWFTASVSSAVMFTWSYRLYLHWNGIWIQYVDVICDIWERQLFCWRYSYIIKGGPVYLIQNTIWAEEDVYYSQYYRWNCHFNRFWFNMGFWLKCFALTSHTSCVAEEIEFIHILTLRNRRKVNKCKWVQWKFLHHRCKMPSNHEKTQKLSCCRSTRAHAETHITAVSESVNLSISFC